LASSSGFLPRNTRFNIPHSPTSTAKMQINSLTALLLAANAAVVHSLTPAKRAEVAAVRRSDFYGGWPLASDTCPANSTTCGQQGTCCPTGTDCYTQGLAGSSVCCPNTGNCVETALSLPVCADPSWTLYIGNYDFFCCTAGQIGFLPNKGSSVDMGLCVNSDVSVPATAFATKYSAGKGLVTSTSVVSSTGSTPVTQSSSTGSASTRSATAAATTAATAATGSTPSSTSPAPSTKTSPSPRTGAASADRVDKFAIWAVAGGALAFFL